MTVEDYLKMQRSAYDETAGTWSISNRDPVVGCYDKHNAWKDYDIYLFKDIPTEGMKALDYGTGPGRNIIKFWNRFAGIDGVDIGAVNLKNAADNLKEAGITESHLMLCDGKSIPAPDCSYDMVFSTICLQHICCYDIRLQIFKESYRVLKAGGHFCFQMGYGGRSLGNTDLGVAWYYENVTNARKTNGKYDVSVTDPAQLRDDLVSIAGFSSMDYDLRPVGPGDKHNNWIFVRAHKGR